MYQLARHYRSQDPHRPRRPIRIQVSIPIEMAVKLAQTQQATGVPIAELAYRLMIGEGETLSPSLEPGHHDTEAALTSAQD